MGFGAFLEPVVAIAPLFGGTWINREPDILGLRSRIHYWSNLGSSRDASDQLPNASESEIRSHDPKTGLQSTGWIPKICRPCMQNQDDLWTKRDIEFWA